MSPFFIAANKLACVLTKDGWQVFDKNVFYWHPKQPTDLECQRKTGVVLFLFYRVDSLRRYFQFLSQCRQRQVVLGTKNL